MNLIKSYYRLQDADGYRTKADELMTTGAELPGVSGKAVPLADEELIAELEEELAIAEGEFEHSWGAVGRLWKPEAIDIKKEAQIEAL